MSVSDAEFRDLSFAMGPGAWFLEKVMIKKKKHVAILGSTGSIGTQSLEVVNAHPDRFVVEVLTANNNSALLIEQAKKHKLKIQKVIIKKKYF